MVSVNSLSRIPAFEKEGFISLIVIHDVSQRRRHTSVSQQSDKCNFHIESLPALVILSAVKF